MKTMIRLLCLALLLPTALMAQKKCVVYLSGDDVPHILCYNPNTGKSVMYHLNEDETEFVKAIYQMPDLPVEAGEQIGMYPYRDESGDEFLLTWNTITGKSKYYVLDRELNEFAVSAYQLPEQPLEGTGPFQFIPYVLNNGADYALVWNPVTGKSLYYNYDSDEEAYVVSEAQLPQLPVAGKGPAALVPYMDADGDDFCLAYLVNTSKVKYYEYNGEKKSYIVSLDQIPGKPIEEEGKFGVMPFLDGKGIDYAFAWNEKTGTSKFYVYYPSLKRYGLDDAQVPANPTGDVGTYGFFAYLDANDDVFALAYNQETGTAKLYQRHDLAKKFYPAKIKVPKL